MKKLISDWFSERDNVTWCIGRAIAFAAAAVMLYKFYTILSPDFQSFAAGVALIIGSVALKNQTEK